jgi:hypothetical protein
VNDREFWVQIRRGLIVMIDAIDQKFALNSVRPSAPASLQITGAQPESAAQASQERISVNGIRNR